jgi:hypothetical protein
VYDETYWSEHRLRLFKQVLPEATRQYWTQAGDIVGDVIIKCPTWFSTKAVGSAGIPAWKMAFEGGVKFHGATGAYVFGDISGGSSDNPQLDYLMKNYYISFIVNGDPNEPVDGIQDVPAERLNWPLYTNGTGEPQVIRITDTVREIVTDPESSEKCRLLSEYASSGARV